MTPLAKQVTAKYSYKNYCEWNDGRWELIEGVEYDMTPAPSRLHQEISMILSAGFYEALKGTDCKVYSAPFDVRLADTPDKNDEAIFTVVQPDISVICDQEKLDDRGCKGAPDLIVEILSLSTASKDMKVKRNIYEKCGVREYWLIHPEEKLIMVLNCAHFYH
nr:Uma2 family endonuclease [Desulfobulbaceae bacterium]